MVRGSVRVRARAWVRVQWYFLKFRSHYGTKNIDFSGGPIVNVLPIAVFERIFSVFFTFE